MLEVSGITIIKYMLLLSITSCVYYSKVSHGTMQIATGRDSVHTEEMEFLEAIYVDSARLVYDPTTTNHLNLLEGDKYVFSFYSCAPPPKWRLIPPKKFIGNYLFVMLDSIHLSDTVDLSGIKMIFFRKILDFGNMEEKVSYCLTGKLIVHKIRADTIWGVISFSGELYDITARKVRTATGWITGCINFSASKSTKKNVSSYLSRIWLQREILNDFIQK